MHTIYKDILDVTTFAPKEKHPAIFDRFDKLQDGESFYISNDHDPKPLYYQMLAERGKTFNWQYLEQGPETWIVHIKKNLNSTHEETVGEISASDIRKAEVFRKFGIDFCCGGRKTLSEACNEKGIDILELKNALELPSEMQAEKANNYNDWDPGFLADYIVQNHHRYIGRQSPVLLELSSKTAQVHGTAHPELKDIDTILHTLLSELDAHMHKEEKVLFPYIKHLQQCSETGKVPEKPVFDTVEMPINIMESEHESAGELFEDIRSLSKDYSLPEDACNTYKLLYAQLSAFEKDLNIHIHLENNILFPKSVEIERNCLKA